MTTNNAINLSASGIVAYNGTGTFTASNVTNHNVLIGGTSNSITSIAPGTAGIPLVSGGATSDPTFSTALVVGGGTGATSFPINGAVFSNTTTTGALSAATLTNGELLIGSSSGAPAAATLTGGTGITITNAANSITISTSGSGFSWVDVTGTTQTIAPATGYVADNTTTGVTFSLPASSSFGDTFQIVGNKTSWSLTQAAGQQVFFGSQATTLGVGGSLSSTNAGDCLEAVCVVAGASSAWRVNDSIGNITVV